MSEEQSGFKVTDRRLFNPDGSPRDIERDEEPAKPESAKQEPPKAAAAAAGVGAHATPPPAQEAETAAQGEELGGDLPGADDPASFVNFLMSIASNAASALGLMEHPVTGERSVDLTLGKHWIDVLGMLQQKTRGNLGPEEQRLLEGMLADLRMQFVSLNSSTRPGSQGFTGRDILGG